MKQFTSFFTKFIFMLSLISLVLSCDSEHSNLDSKKSWKTALLIEDGAGIASRPQIVMDNYGNAIAVWQQLDNSVTRIWASRYIKDGEWSTPRSLKTGSTVDARFPRLVVNSSTGNAAVIWKEDLEIWSNFYSPVSGWEAAVRVENNNPGTPLSHNIAIDAYMNVTVVWSQYVEPSQKLIWANQYTQGSGWGIARMISTNIGWAHSPTVAVTDNGNVIASWVQNDINNNDNTWVSHKELGSGWSTPTSIGNDNIYLPYYSCSPVCLQGNFNPSIDTVNNSTSIVIWEEYDTNAGGVKILSNISNSFSTWDIPLAVGGGRSLYSSNVALDDDGNALAVWVSGSEVSGLYSVWGNNYSVGTGWGTASRIQTGSSGDVGPSDPLPIEFNENDQAIILWTKSDKTGKNIWANHYNPESGWSSDKLVQEDVKSYGPPPDLAMSQDGSAIAIWSHEVGAHEDIWVSHYK